MSRTHATAFFVVFCTWISADRAGEIGLPKPEVPSGFGVNIHFTEPVLGEMDRFAQAGYRLARMDLTWSAVERQGGVYDFAAHDRLVAHLSKAGARPLFILDYGNPLYDGGRSPFTEAGRAAFARFAAAAAAHFRGRGIIWEIWNEPNLAQFWKPQPNADDYARLAVTTAMAVRAADPDAVILAPGSSDFPWEFFETIFRGGVLNHVDAVSVHPYRRTPPESAASDFGRLRALIARHAPHDKRNLPIVCSEWGYSTAIGGVSEARQASYLTRMWLANLAAGVNLSIFYDWRDDGNDPRENEFRFGTVRRDLTPKPSFLAASSLIRELNGFAFRHRIRGKGADDWELLFQRGDTQELALVTWNAEPNAPDNRQRPSVRRIGASDRDFVSLYRLASLRYPAGALTHATGRAAEIAVTLVNTNRLSGDFKVVAGDTSVLIPVQSGHDVTRRVALPAMDARDERVDVPFRVLWDGEVLRELAPLTLWRVDPLRLIATPRGSQLEATVENPARVPFRGTLAVLTSGETSTSTSLAIPERADRGTVQIPRPGKTHRLVLKDSSGKIAASLGPRRYEPMVDFPVREGEASGFNLTLFVDNAPRPRVPLAAVAAGPDGPAPVALAVPYRFDRGWRYIEAAPSQARIPAGTVALTFWARSTSEHDHLRSRYRDSTGQAFQLDLGRLGWTGWRPVTVPLDGSLIGSHWGGAGDGVPHAPLSWEGLVLIDSARRDAPHRGEILIASPFYVFAR